MGGAAVEQGPGRVKAPDGGWGWAVLVGCFVITGFSYAFPKAVSVFFKELIREFDVGYSDTAWISSILLAMLYGSGRSQHLTHTAPIHSIIYTQLNTHTARIKATQYTQHYIHTV